MAKQETTNRLQEYDRNIVGANTIPTLNAIVTRTSSQLLTPLGNDFHITQQNRDQLQQIRTKLESKRDLINDQRTQLTDDNTRLSAENTNLAASITNKQARFNAELATIRGTRVGSGDIIDTTSFPANYAGLGGSFIMPYPVYIPYDPITHGAANQRSYNDTQNRIDQRINNLQGILQQIETATQTSTNNTTKITANNGVLGTIAPTETELTTKIADLNTLSTTSDDFVGLDGTDCRAQMTGATYETFDDLLLPGTTGAVFGLRQANGHPLQSVSVGGNDYYQVLLTLADGTRLTRLIRDGELRIDRTNGRVTFDQNAQLYDPTGAVYLPPQGQIQFDIYPSVTRTAAGITPVINLYHTKKLTISRKMDMSNSIRVFNNPSFTTELTNRMGIAYREHIEDIDHEESQIYKTIRGHLDKYPDFARLADSQKEELYHNVLAVTQVDHTIPGAPVPGPLLSASITATHARDTITNTMSAHSDLFAAYVQDEKIVDPKPTAEDTKDEVSYRDWLTRNLTTLTKNYIGHRLTHYLETSDVTQAVNDAITRYVTTYDRDVIDNDRDLVPNINIAVTALRRCLPESKNNKAWTTLMTGRTAQIKDSVTYRKDTFTYTTDVVFSNAPAISATLQLNNDDPITLHGRTPGDLLAKIMTGGGARIDGQRERLHMAFGTMKAIIKSNPAYAAGLSVPINNANTGVGETNGPELRISLDAHDKIKVERYNFDATRNEMVKSLNTGDVFDESNPHDKERLTHGFVVNLNSAMNRIMDHQYTSYRDTISDAKHPLRTISNRLGLSRERMSYKAEPRLLRGLLTKWINRKQPGVEAFAFPVTVGNQTMNIDYQPNGTITLEANGKTRKGKNLAKLLNPTSMSIFGGIFANKKNFTDGFEIPVMQGLYDGLSRQLMHNERVNQYTYLVRDPVTKIVYTMHSDPNGEPQIGVIENVTGPVSNTRTRDMLLISRQKRGRTKGIPPQGIRQLNEAEKHAILGRPDIMDGFMQNMLKAREELIHVPVSGYRGLSLNALGLGTAATAGAGLATLGGIDLASGGLLSSSLYSAGAATNNFVTGTAPQTMWTVTNNAATAAGKVLAAGTHVVTAPAKGVLGMAA